MSTPILTDFIKNTIGKAVDGLIQKYLPAAMSGEKKAQFELEKEKLAMELQQMWLDQEKAFRESVNTYENPAGLSQWMLNFRSGVRPIITYASFGLLAYILIFGYEVEWVKLKDIPAEIWWIFLAIFGFWFGGRAVWDSKNGKI